MPQPSQPSQPEDRQHQIRCLLYKAVRGLPEEEQEVIFRHFFELGIVPPPAAPLAPGGAVHRGALLAPDEATLATVFTQRKQMGPDQILIPVRLAEAQHRRLKEWCAEHDFPMAVVVRGLIDRFLDSTEKRAA